jgi:hypothetical protein
LRELRGHGTTFGFDFAGHLMVSIRARKRRSDVALLRVPDRRKRPVGDPDEPGSYRSKRDAIPCTRAGRNIGGHARQRHHAYMSGDIRHPLRRPRQFGQLPCPKLSLDPRQPPGHVLDRVADQRLCLVLAEFGIKTRQPLAIESHVFLV